MRVLPRTLALVLAASCTHTTAPERVRVLAEVPGYDDDDPRITVRRQGRTVDVTVRTYGDGCLAKGDTEVVVHFQQAGSARLRIRGIDARSRTSDNASGDTVVVERTAELP